MAIAAASMRRRRRRGVPKTPGPHSRRRAPRRRLLRPPRAPTPSSGPRRRPYEELRLAAASTPRVHRAGVNPKPQVPTGRRPLRLCLRSLRRAATPSPSSPFRPAARRLLRSSVPGCHPCTIACRRTARCRPSSSPSAACFHLIRPPAGTKHFALSLYREITLLRFDLFGDLVPGCRLGIEEEKLEEEAGAFLAVPLPSVPARFCHEPLPPHRIEGRSPQVGSSDSSGRGTQGALQRTSSLCIQFLSFSRIINHVGLGYHTNWS
jgi:hypothetical protein